MELEALLPATMVGLVGGTLVGMTGVGAGSVIAAMLLVLYPGVVPQVIVGSATIQAVAMKVAGVWARRQSGLNERGLALAMAAGAIPLAVAGALASSRLSGVALKPIVSLALLVVGGHLVFQAAHALWRRTGGRSGAGGGSVVDELGGAVRGAGAPAAHDAEGLAAQAVDPGRAKVGILGAAVGFIAGLTSIGTGTLFVSVLAGPLRVGAHRAVGAALLAGLMTLVVSGATHAMLGHFEGALVVGTCLGSVPGVLVGTALSHRLQARALRGVIGVGIIVAAIVALARVR